MTHRNGRSADENQLVNRFECGPFDEKRFLESLPTSPQQRGTVMGDNGIMHLNEGTSVWGWIAGIAVVALIAIVVISGWQGVPTR